MNTKKVVLGKDVPDVVNDHAKVRAQIKALKGSSKQYPAVSNPTNTADAKVDAIRKGATVWDKNSPFRQEEFKTGSADYRGQGLLPSDKTNGVRVVDKK